MGGVIPIFELGGINMRLAVKALLGIIGSSCVLHYYGQTGLVCYMVGAVVVFFYFWIDD